MLGDRVGRRGSKNNQQISKWQAVSELARPEKRRTEQSDSRT
jgi:hypothetical protein